MEEVSDPHEQSERLPSRLSQHIMRAEFASFQEYFYTATKGNDKFEVSGNLRHGDKAVGNPETDLLRIPGSTDYVAVELVHALEDYIHLPPRREPNSPSMRYGDFYCVYGEKDGKFIFQGAGIIHRDSSWRQNDSSLKLVFDSQDSLEAFMQLMEEGPAEALAGVTREIYPAVSERVLYFKKMDWKIDYE